jgi:hypothetical protein
MDREAQHKWAEKAIFAIDGLLPEGNVEFSWRLPGRFC